MGPSPRWYAIAKNEWRLRTSAIRGARRVLLPLLLVVMVVHVGWIAPALVASLVPSFLALLLSSVALATMELSLLTFFCYLLVIPFSNALRDIRLRDQEILLAAPVTPGDILLGKFLGAMPLYALGLALIIGVFTALLVPVGLDAVQLVLSVVVILLVLFSALWIGAVAAAVVRTRLERSARGRDAGKALGFVMALPIILVTYALLYGFLPESGVRPAADPAVAAFLSILPSSWGADVVMAFAAHPGDLGALELGDLLRLVGVVVFFVAALGVGAVVASRAYGSEPSTFTVLRARPDGVLYRGLRALGGPGLLTVFKEYARRLENISRLVYVVGLVILLRVFGGGGSESPTSAALVIVVFGPFIAAFAVSDVTARGKDILFLYRRSPSGEVALVRSKLVQGLIITVPMAVAFVAMLAWGTTEGPLFYLAVLGESALVGAIDVALVLGICLILPTFSDSPQTLVLSGMAPMIASLVASLVLLIALGRVLGTVVLLVASAAVAAGLIILGMRRLRGIE